jgi:hypothetical protein
MKFGGLSEFLGAFEKFRRATISFVMSVLRPSVCQPARMEHLGSHCKEFYKI